MRRLALLCLISLSVASLVEGGSGAEDVSPPSAVTEDRRENHGTTNLRNAEGRQLGKKKKKEHEHDNDIGYPQFFPFPIPQSQPPPPAPPQPILFPLPPPPPPQKPEVVVQDRIVPKVVEVPGPTETVFVEVPVPIEVPVEVQVPVPVFLSANSGKVGPVCGKGGCEKGSSNSFAGLSAFGSSAYSGKGIPTGGFSGYSGFGGYSGLGTSGFSGSGYGPLSGLSGYSGLGNSGGYSSRSFSGASASAGSSRVGTWDHPRGTY